MAIRRIQEHLPPRNIRWEFVNLIETDPARPLPLKLPPHPISGLPPAAISGIIKLESVIKAINSKFSGKVAEGNIAAATEAYQTVLAEKQAATQGA